MKWLQFLAPYSQGDDQLFDKAFIERWGDEEWDPNSEDKVAAAKLHVQLVSRITTQPLGYLEGVEKTALKSVYELFEYTRKICTEHFEARHFSILAWHVLNTHVRGFTAKWHPVSERGMLSALDTTDEFRADLEERQRYLRQFETLLAHLRNGKPPPPKIQPGETDRESAIVAEMGRSVSWGIPPVQGGIEKGADVINTEERKAIEDRRGHYYPDREDKKNKAHAVGLALSGGGIRSATFSLGGPVALARRDLLPQFDYLSTVSGGGYLGSFLTAFLSSANKVGIGLRSDELPFRHKGGEAKALRHIRHHSKYLASGLITDRLRMLGAQLWGMVLNGLAVAFLAAVAALIEKFLRATHVLNHMWPQAHVWPQAIVAVASVLGVWAMIALALGRGGKNLQKVGDTGLVIIGGILCALFVWVGLEQCHVRIRAGVHLPLLSTKTLLAILGGIPVVSSAFAGIAGKFFDRIKFLLGLLSVISAPLFFFGVYLALYWCAENSPSAYTCGNFAITWFQVFAALLAIIYFWVLNINVTSPHRHYRKKLAQAYLIQAADGSPADGPFKEDVELKLSATNSKLAPYHLINAALNVPASKNPAMQGRLADFFLFSRHFCGSPLTGYHPTTQWQGKDGHLDLGTAMAISGAAAAPQMGLGTKRRLSFWLALFNVRLGYWVRDPAKKAGVYGGAPGLLFLLKEMLGSMDERAPWLYVSDGGHIENLGIYELLRRRCKYIVAVDGEQDERMTFGALTTLQRLAAIDLGVKIDINLDDLRLNELGLSRSHFRFCRIEYPGSQYGYLLYVKSSLTGNEGEFLRRYRLDEPSFPHQPTADQFFSEAQFEAYRTLGEHIGDKLFLRALVGKDLANSNSIEIESLFLEFGKRLLEKRR